MELQFTPVADYALLVSFGDKISDEVHRSILALDKAIAKLKPNGLVEVVPAMVNLLVVFDPLTTDSSIMEQELRHLVDDLEYSIPKFSKRIIQVCYEEPFAMDLEAVAHTTGLDTGAVIEAHLTGDYKVMMYGFAPGYAYMAGVDETIQVPRKPSAVRDIPAGSVLIAGQQCLVTTLKMPTGWSIIGRSPTQILFDDPNRPFLFDVGDKVCFEQIDRETFDRLHEVSENG